MKTNNKLRIILDTNIFLVSISTKSQYQWLFKSLLNGDYNLYITNEILTEYEEIISNKFNINVAKDVVKMLMILPNVYKSEIYYKWRLIQEDAVDNKFSDCYISSDADYLITHDKHFSILKEIDFPKVNLLKIEEFQSILSKNKTQ